MTSASNLLKGRADTNSDVPHLDKIFSRDCSNGLAAVQFDRSEQNSGICLSNWILLLSEHIFFSMPPFFSKSGGNILLAMLLKLALRRAVGVL